MLLDSDAHEPGDLLSPSYAMKVARGAGLDEHEAKALLEDGPRALLEKVGVPYDGDYAFQL